MHRWKTGNILRVDTQLGKAGMWDSMGSDRRLPGKENLLYGL